MIEKPQIITLNLTEKTNNLLIENNYNIYNGSLGQLVETNNTRGEFKYCLLNYDFPKNIHEFDVVIIDLSNEEHIQYNKDENKRTINKTKNNSYLISEYPQTIFDPRGFSSYILLEEINKIIQRDSIIIVMQNENEPITYELVKDNGSYPERLGKQEHSIYDFMPIFPFAKNKYGKETKVVVNNEEFRDLLEKYNSEFTYKTVYNHPTIWKEEKRENNPSFYPLVKNKDDEIVSFVFFGESYGLYLFPSLVDNSLFLLNFLQSIAPSIHPNVFPFSTEKKWTNKTEYALPNHLNLLEEKKLINEEYSLKVQNKDEEIRLNIDKYQFLHDILSETGDELVQSVIKYLEWLEFDNIKDVDSENSEIKEEDIQIETNKGLIVIEVKGIGGTSKDSECSQISKIKYRRSKERGKFDVYGLYLVNHQRHLPPLDRQNPPFSKEQLLDSLNEERGLLTTWQLFNLYFDIQNGIISKEEARINLYDYGLVNFKPANLVEIATVNETFIDGFVSIINIKNVELKPGFKLFVEKNNRFKVVEIVEIKVDDKTVDSVENGEIGIKTNLKISKKSKIWMKNLP